jgi:ubiquinol-cytochrome c reductase cytochrome b subunit
MGGFFLEHANFEPADPLATPEHIAPVWYFTPFYTVLRAVPDPFIGVMAMGAAVVILFFVPWLDRNPVKSVRYRSIAHRINLIVFAITFIILGYLGVQPVSALYGELGLRLSTMYFLFFWLLWFHSRERSVVFSLLSFAVIVGLYSFYDMLRIGATDPTLVMTLWLLPTLYLLVTMVVPALVQDLRRDRPVPERVTA